MFSFVKVLLYTYPHLESIIGDIDKLVCLKAYTSFGTSCERAAEKIIDTIDKKRRLLNLKVVLDDLILKLNDEEKWLLEHKYFRRRKFIKKYLGCTTVTFSERTYFRKQNRLLSKLSWLLSLKGMSEEWFLDNYSDIDWFSSFYKRIKSEQKTAQKAS